MLFSTLGDLALMDFRRFFSRHTRSPFVTGGILFMLAHLLYASAFASRARGVFCAAGVLTAVTMGIGVYLSLILMSRRNGYLTGKRALLLLLYATSEFADCAAVFACGFPLPASPGIVLFIVSDYFIGMDKAAGDGRLTRYIWLFYSLGQLLLLLGA